MRPPYLLQSIVLLLALANAAAAESRVDCGEVNSKFVPQSVGYCALLPSSYDQDKTKRFPVLYLLHGLGDNHQTVINNGIWNLVEELQRKKEIGEFVIITPQGGRTFYLNSKSGQVKYEDFLLRDLIPAMERKFRIRKTRSQRAISGISMGGYGALRTAFKHPQLFSAVSAHSAALLEEMPKGAEAAGLGMFMGPSFGTPFDPQYWKNNTPFIFARRSNLNGLKIYFDCGNSDEYGFERGAASLHKVLQRRGVKHEFHIEPGTHNWRYFADHLPKSLEFHSKAFGLTK